MHFTYLQCRSVWLNTLTFFNSSNGRKSNIPKFIKVNKNSKTMLKGMPAYVSVSHTFDVHLHMLGQFVKVQTCSERSSKPFKIAYQSLVYIEVISSV